VQRRDLQCSMFELGETSLAPRVTLAVMLGLRVALA
jgi:hypothetical protein